jgi:hypothetical protein
VNANGPSNPRVALDIARALQELNRHFFELQRKRFVGRLPRKLHQVMRVRAKVNEHLLMHMPLPDEWRPAGIVDRIVESYHAPGITMFEKAGGFLRAGSGTSASPASAMVPGFSA